MNCRKIIILVIGIGMLNCLYSQNKLVAKIGEFCAEIEKVRGSKFFIIPKLRPISRKELRKVAINFLKGDPYIKSVLPLYFKMGLIEKSYRRRTINSLMKKAFVEQITAFFSPAQNTIYFNTHNIVKPLPEFRFGERIGLIPLESIFVHELTHALDHQNFLSKVNSLNGEGVYRVINEGSAMFTLFLYAASMAKKPAKEFIKSNIKHLPLHYERTGYKNFDNLPAIVRYDMTLPYSVGAYLFYRMYKLHNLGAFEKIFSHQFCSLSNLIAYVYNSYTFCTKRKEYNGKLFHDADNSIKFISSFSELNILSLLLLADHTFDYKILRYIRSHRVFEHRNKAVLLYLKFKNEKVARKVYRSLYKRYGCQTGKCVPGETMDFLKRAWDFTGLVLNAGNEHYLVRAKTNLLLFLSYNKIDGKIRKWWKKILKSIK